MRSVDCMGLLAEDNPDALVLAVLCDFGEREPQSVVNGIFLRLRELVGDQTGLPLQVISALRDELR